MRDARTMLTDSRREFIVRTVLLACASVSFLAVFLIFMFILKESLPSIAKIGVKNLFFSADWRPSVSNPDAGHYGMLAFIVGTIMTTFFAMILGAPLGIGTAIFIEQIAPKKVREITRRGVELLAGIPSVVIGWFGLTMLVPFIAKLTGSAGYGIAAASLVLVVMVLPTITALSAEGLKAVPVDIKEASVAMGATRWQTIYRVILPSAKESLLVATILGMGRAIGETMAVQMVIGNAKQLAFSPLQRTSTLTSRIVTDMGEAPPGVFRSALFAQALVLLILAMVLITVIKLVTRSRGGNT